jgi:hypothetical protein
MIKELTEYYNRERILSTNFDCPFKSQCSGQNPNGLVEGKAAYIGKAYEDHTVPRVLFISLDMGSDQDFETRQKRTPEGVRQIEGHRNWQTLNPLWHWYETHYFAWRLIEKLGYPCSKADANQIFAHTNSAKCCEKKKGRDMSHDVLYNNCRAYIKEEVEILDPDIIVGQGDKAYKAVLSNFPEISQEGEFASVTQIHERIHVFLVNEHPVLFLQTIYPSWRNNRTNIQRHELYPFYLEAVEKYSKIVPGITSLGK